jgi:hypothetical protein
MMKRFLAALLPFLGTSCSERQTANEKVQLIDPKQILFSLPTLCDPAPAVDAGPAAAGARQLHEDDWRQIEFVPANNLDHIRKELEELAAFKREHQRANGWTQIYLRKEHPTPLAAIRLRFAALPVLSASDLALGGRPVRGGFALSEGGPWFVYGQRTPEGAILHLAVSPSGAACSKDFAQSLAMIAQSADLLLVNWYAGALVDTTSADSVLAAFQH